MHPKADEFADDEPLDVDFTYRFAEGVVGFEDSRHGISEINPLLYRTLVRFEL